MELKPGYKRTEVGVIPEDWEVKPLGELASVTAGGTPSRTNAKYWQGDIPWVTTSEVDFYTIQHAEQLITKEGLNNSAAKLLPSGTLLMALYGQGKTRGKVGILGIEAATNQACAAISLKQGISREFLFHFLASRYDAIRNLSNTGNQENLNSSLVRSILVSLPSAAEQRAITAALSDVDALLEGLTRLIAKKRELKQAAMQQLLTGETRLPRFHGDWVAKRLGDVISDCFSGATPRRNRPEFYRGDVRWITSGELNYNVITDTIEKISRDAVAETCLTTLPVGTFLMAITGLEAEGTRGACAIVGAPSTTNQSCMAVFPTTALKTAFLFHYYVFRGKDLALQYCQGTKQQSYTAGLVKQLPINLPPTTDEQTAIAAVLSDMDAELAALEARRDKTRALKQAMMQELLTGRTRLVVPAVTENRKASERTDGRRANIHFMRSVLAAEIIDRLHAEPTFGHVKFEKMIFLVEHLCDVDTGSTYHRDAAGPYDNRAMRSIDSQLRKQQWFDARKIEGRYRYEPMTHRGKHKEYFERYFAGISPAFDTVIDTFRGLKTEKCEIVATLFGAWNDLINQKRPISDDAIVNEVLNNWHESKKRIPEDRWRKALSWMRNKSFVPHQATGDRS